MQLQMAVTNVKPIISLKLLSAFTVDNYTKMTELIDQTGSVDYQFFVKTRMELLSIKSCVFRRQLPITDHSPLLK